MIKNMYLWSVEMTQSHSIVTQIHYLYGSMQGLLDIGMTAAKWIF